MKNFIKIMTILLLGVTGQQLTAVNPQNFPKVNTLDMLPQELRSIIAQYVLSGKTLNEAVTGMKNFYVAFPAKRNDLALNKAIISNLITRFNLTSSDLYQLQQSFDEFEVFKNPAMESWLEQKIGALKNAKNLRKAVLAQDADRVAALLALPADDLDIDAQDETGMSLLAIAAAYPNINITRMILDRGANPNLEAKFGMALWMTPIGSPEITSDAQRIATLQLLLERGAKVNVSTEPGKTVLDNIQNQDIKKLILEAARK